MIYSLYMYWPAGKNHAGAQEFQADIFETFRRGAGSAAGPTLNPI